jgi:hypothetical protein
MRRRLVIAAGLVVTPNSSSSMRLAPAPEPAPTLAPLTLGLAGAAHGELGGVAVTMLAYRAPSGNG